MSASRASMGLSVFFPDSTSEVLLIRLRMAPKLFPRSVSETDKLNFSRLLIICLQSKGFRVRPDLVSFPPEARQGYRRNKAEPTIAPC